MPTPATITVDGVEYIPAAQNSEIKIVRANRGYRDYIYVGRLTVLDNGDVQVAPGGACIREYREKGLTGALHDPRWMRAPGRTLVRALIRSPLTKVPLLLPRSVTAHSPGVTDRSSRAWWRETVLSSTTTSLSVARPKVMTAALRSAMDRGVPMCSCSIMVPL